MRCMEDEFTAAMTNRELVGRANSVPILLVFKHYGIKDIDESNRKVVCPFPAHKGGREQTSSFVYYPQTNTFWCFGCKIGVHCCDFVAAMDSTNKITAAQKILSIFESDSFDIGELERADFSEKVEAMLKFSELILEFRSSHFDEKSLNYIERVCQAYDLINSKHELTNEALQFLTKQFKNKIEAYKI